MQTVVIVVHLMLVAALIATEISKGGRSLNLLLGKVLEVFEGERAQRVPPWVGWVGVAGADAALVAVDAAHRAQPGAILPAQRRRGQIEQDRVAPDAVLALKRALVAFPSPLFGLAPQRPVGPAQPQHAPTALCVQFSVRCLNMVHSQ